MFETYIPGFSNELFRSQLLNSDAGLTGGGPAYTTITPDFMPEPAEGPAPAAMTPQEEFQARVRQIEAMVPGTQAAQPPSIMPSPSAPPMMSAPSTYIPGFTNMLMRPDLLEGGPAYTDMAPGAMPERVSMLPFAPEASPPSSLTPPPAATTPRGLLAEDIFLGDGVRDVAIDPAMRGIYGAGSETSPATPGLGQFQLSNDMIRNALSTMPGAARAAPSPYVRPTLNPSLGFQTQGDQQGYFFVTNRGRAAKTKDNPSAFVAVNPNAQYRLVNERSKNAIAASGLGEAGLQSAYQTAQRLSKEQGKKADWRLEVFDPSVGRWVVKADDDPSKNILGKIADIALPLAGALLVPGIGLVGSKVLAAGLGAAAGSGLSSAAQGRSLGDTLLRAGLSGAGAAGGAALGKVAGTALSKGAAQAGGTVGDVATQAATQKLAQTGAQAIPEILITGSKAALTGATLGGALGGGASGALSSMAPGRGADFADRVFEQPTTPAVQVPSPLDTVAGDPITVLANRAPTGGALPFATAGAGALAQPGVDAAINSIKQQIEQKQAEQEPKDQEILVEAAREKARTGGALTGADLDLIIGSGAGASAAGLLEKGEVPPEKKDLLDKLQDRIKGLDVVDYLRLAGILLPLLDGGGGGRRASRTLPTGMFGGSSVFGGGLPRATLPGASTGFAPRAPSTLRPRTAQDWYRYGYGPEQSFFDYVPEGERNTSQAYTGYALGGMAVNGPGTGRSDEIPAMLSDGEYVMDAETVALLGDGSSKAGAERLDQFRANVRKHKGRHLAKGDFSVNAKRPEKYLKGGRA